MNRAVRRLGCNIFIERVPGHTLDIMLMLSNLSYEIACEGLEAVSYSK